MYYKALGYLTHHGIRWYLGRRLPDRRQVQTVAGTGIAAIVLMAGLGLFLRARRPVPTV